MLYDTILQGYLNDLEKQGIIRRSDDQWRTPIRALRMPNGETRVTSNLMALNELKKFYSKIAN